MSMVDMNYPNPPDHFPAQINDMLDRIAALERLQPVSSIADRAFATALSVADRAAATAADVVVSTGDRAFATAADSVVSTGDRAFATAADVTQRTTSDTLYVNVAGDTMTGNLSVGGGGESIRFPYAGAYQAWYNGATRIAYIQGNAGGLMVNSESGTMTLSSPSSINLQMAGNSAYPAVRGSDQNLILKAEHVVITTDAASQYTVFFSQAFPSVCKAVMIGFAHGPAYPYVTVIHNGFPAPWGFQGTVWAGPNGMGAAAIDLYYIAVGY